MQSLHNPVDTEDDFSEVDPSIGRILSRFIVWGVIVTVLAELLLRTFFISPSRQHFDAELGWQYIPNSKIVYSSEGYAIHRLNELGMNDESLAEKNNQEKILVLGDSFTEALEVARDKNFVSQLDNRFDEIDFVNAGRGAYAPPHQLIVIKRMAAHMQQARNLLFLSHGDIHDLISLPLDITQTPEGVISFLVPVNEGKDAIKDKFRVILHNSALATYIMRRYHREIKKFIRFVASPCIWKCQSRGSMNAQPKQGAIEKASIASDHKKEKDMLTYIFNKLETTAPTLIFYIPNVIYKTQGNAAISDYSLKELGIIEAAARSSGLPFYDLSQQFFNDYKKTGFAAFGFSNTQVGGEGHLNSHGHQVVATYVESVLKSTQ